MNSPEEEIEAGEDLTGFQVFRFRKGGKEEQYEEDIQEGLLRFHSRSHWQPSEEKTPLDVLLARDPIADRLERLTADQLDERLAEHGIVLASEVTIADRVNILRAFRGAESNIRNETARRLYDYFAQDGVDPRSVLRAVYAVGAHMGLSPYCELNLRERALMLGDSHGAQHFRTQKLCVDPLRRIGARSVKAPGQKSFASRGVFSRAQTAAQADGNSNRKRKVRRRRRERRKKNG